MPEALKQHATIGKEIWMRHAIIFQDYSLLHVIKKPGNCPTNSNPAPEIHRRIEPVNIARPINFIVNTVSCGGNLLCLTRSIRAGAIAGNKESFWSDDANSIDNSAQSMWPPPYDQENGQR
jgi:hypothetical protein